MILSPSSLLKIDRLFRLPNKWWTAGEWQLNNEPESKILVIKLMGLGSLIRFAALCDERGVDKSKIVLLTFDSHREVGPLFGFNHNLLIRTASVFTFISDSIRVLKRSRSLKLSLVLDLERCSYAVGLFGTLIARRAKCHKVSFENLDEDKFSLATDIFATSNRTFDNILRTGIAYLPASVTAQRTSTITLKSNRVMVNINASTYLLARRYPMKAFFELVQAIHSQNTDLEFHFTGSDHEIDYVNDLVRMLSSNNIRAVNRAGSLTLGELSRKLSSCVLFITGDSGPLHLAAYLKVPTLAIWGPTQPSHFGYQDLPFMFHATKSLSCSPCFKDPTSKPAVACQGKITCMNFETQALAREAVAKILQQPASREINLPSGLHAISVEATA